MWPIAEPRAAWYERIGRVPIERIRWTPRPGLATERDLVNLNDRDRVGLFELIDGVLVEKAYGFLESVLTVEIGVGIGRWMDEVGDAGVVVGTTASITLPNGDIRLPDTSYYRPSRFPEGTIPREPCPLLVPDLVVSVVKPDNTNLELERRRSDYFAAGTELIWEVDPRLRTVTICTSPDSFHVVAADIPVDGANVLPGFTFTLDDLLTRTRAPRPEYA